MSEEAGWLVARPGLTGPLYWSGTVFSGSTEEALRFSRRVDAERAIERLHLAGASPAQARPARPSPRQPAAPSWREG